MSAPQRCLGYFTGQPQARSGSRSGISESPARGPQPQHRPPGPGTRMKGRNLGDSGILRAAAEIRHSSYHMEPSLEDRPQIYY